MKLIAIAVILSLLCIIQGRYEKSEERESDRNSHAEIYTTFDDSDYYFENEPIRKVPEPRKKIPTSVKKVPVPSCKANSCNRKLKREVEVQKEILEDDQEWEDDPDFSYEVIEVSVKQKTTPKSTPRLRHKNRPEPRSKPIRRPQPISESLCNGPTCRGSSISLCNGPTCRRSSFSPCSGPICRPHRRPHHRPRPPIDPVPLPDPVPIPTPRVHEDRNLQRNVEAIEGANEDYWTSYELEDNTYVSADRYEPATLPGRAPRRR